MARRLHRTAVDSPAYEFGKAADTYLRSLETEHDEASMALGLRLVRTGNAFIQASERTVQRPRGLRWAGFSAMFILLVFRTLEARTIAKLTGVSRQAASTVLAVLQRAGHIHRSEAGGSDRRLVPLTLTESGRDLAHEVLNAQLVLSDRWFGVLDAEERRDLNRLLEKLLVENRSAPNLPAVGDPADDSASR